MDYQSSILSALIPKTVSEKPEADQAVKLAIEANLTPNYFSGPHRFIFEAILEQFTKESILDREIFETYLTKGKLKEDEKIQYRIAFASCKEATTDREKLRELIPAFIEQENTKTLGEVLTDTARILKDGVEIGKNRVQGVEEAKKFLITRLSGLEKLSPTKAPQGELTKSMDRFWSVYQEEKNNPNAGIKCGFSREFDQVTRGIKRGELFTIAGSAKEGKSQFLRNYAYNAAVNQRKNVVYISLEMSFDQVNRLFVSLHSTSTKFGNPLGIKDVSIASGNLSPEEEQQLRIVTEDLVNSTNYGVLYNLQLPSGSNMYTLQNKMVYLNSLFPIDALFLDYASLLKPNSPKDTTVQETTDIFRELHEMARTFDNGLGLPIVTAHQISRAKREAVDKMENKRYDRGYLSDSSEVEKSSDLCGWILRTEELSQNREVKCGISHFRRGPLPPDWMLREYFDCSKLESLSTIESGGPGIYEL